MWQKRKKRTRVPNLWRRWSLLSIVCWDRWCCDMKNPNPTKQKGFGKDGKMQRWRWWALLRQMLFRVWSKPKNPTKKNFWKWLCGDAECISCHDDAERKKIPSTWIHTLFLFFWASHDDYSRVWNSRSFKKRLSRRRREEARCKEWLLQWWETLQSGSPAPSSSLQEQHQLWPWHQKVVELVTGTARVIGLSPSLITNRTNSERFKRKGRQYSHTRRRCTHSCKRLQTKVAGVVFLELLLLLLVLLLLLLLLLLFSSAAISAPHFISALVAPHTMPIPINQATTAISSLQSHVLHENARNPKP